MISGDGRIITSKENTTEKDHAATINIMIDAVLSDVGITLKDIRAIAVCIGPGSYTGLRIGMATAKGICYAMDIPMICHNKLELMVDDRVGDELRISLLQARENEYFMLNNDACDDYSRPIHLSSNEVNDYLVTLSQNSIKIFGNISDEIIREKNTIVKPTDRPNQHLWSISAFSNFINHIFVNTAHIEPLYIKSVFINKKS